MTTTEATVTASDLANEIQNLEAFPEALQRRVRGVSWMLWGLILGAVFVTYDYVGLSHQVYGGSEFLFAFLWVPWVALGVVASVALWKANGLTGSMKSGIRKTVITFLLFAFVVFLFFVGYHFSRIWESSPLVGPSVMLTMMGLAAIVIGAVGLTCHDSTDRILWVVGGVFLLAVVIAGTLVAGNDTNQALRVFGAVGPLATLLVYFGNGLYLTLKG